MKNSPKTVDSFISTLPDFSRPMVERMRKAVVAAAPDLDEDLRWGVPTYKGKALVCGLAAFKNHVSLTLWRGAKLSDPNGILTHGQGLSEMRTAKFESIEEIDTKQIQDWVKQALTLDSSPSAPSRKVLAPVKVKIPKALGAALKKDARAHETFDALPPSHQREYCEWIAEAKQATTVERRLVATIEKLRRGEGLNDKYRR